MQINNSNILNPLEKLIANDTLIMLVDLQPEIVAAANKTTAQTSIRQATSVLLEGAKILEIPVFLSAVPLQPDVQPTLISELENYPVIIRSTAGVFDDPVSQHSIGNYDRRVIILGGVATELTVLQSALGARRLGYTVYLLTDLCGGLSDRTEQATFRQLESAGVVLSSVAAFLSSLMPPPTDPKANALFAALSRFMG